MVSIPKKIQLFLAGALSRQTPSKEHVGQAGEEAIARYIKQQGWKILARNWRPEGAYHGLELDIIAKKEDTLLFIEVKTRIFPQRHHGETLQNSTLSAQKEQENQHDPLPDTTNASPLPAQKTKNNEQRDYIPAYASFTKKKQQSMLRAARYYLASTELWDMPCQFDLFCVQEYSSGEFGIEHYEHVIEIGQTLDSRHSHWEPW